MTNRVRPGKARLRTGRTAVDRAPLPEGKVRCPGCFQAVSLTKNGHLRAHKGADGFPCAHRVYGTAVEMTETPEVVFPALRKPPTRPAVAKVEPVRVVTGHCHTCDRQVSGERIYCGPCLAKRGRL